MKDSRSELNNQPFRRRQIAALLARLGTSAVVGGLLLGSLQVQAADLTPELKAQIALSSLRGEKTDAELAQEYKVDPAQIAEWKQQLLNHAKDAFASQQPNIEGTAPETSAPAAAEAEAPQSNELEKVVITARNREEIAQDVPLPVSVIGGKQLDRDHVVDVQDLTRKAPGLTATTPNARRTGIAIRGIGKASANDSMEAAVGVIVDDVFLTHVGMTYQDFTDLDRVEVLRGPQGTLLGKNTTVGAIHYVSKAPSFTPQGSIELETGGNQHDTTSPASIKGKGSYSDAIIDNVLAYRASFFVDKQDGDFKNINTEGGTYQEKNRYGGRLQLLLTPTDTLSVKLNLDAAQSRENSNTKPWIIDPTTFANGASRTAGTGLTFTSRLARSYFNGYTPVIGSRDKIDIGQAEPLYTNNRGASANINWDLGPVTLTSISAYRRLNFDARNDSDQTKFDINRGGTLVDHEQFSQEFRLTSPQSKTLDYQVGLYLMHEEAESTSRTLYGEDAGAFYASTARYNTLSATAAGLAALKASLNNVYVTSLTTPETDSAALFGQINWHLTDKATLTLGLRDSYEDKTATYNKLASFYDGSALTSTGNATADAVRASQVTNLTGTLKGQEISGSSLSWLVNPSYEVSEDLTVYASAAHGEKSGSVQFSSTGQPQNVDPEKSLDFELGFKSLLLEKSLMLNVNLYQTTVKDYQATTSVVDATSSTGYSSILGNIPEIQARGVEVDGAFRATNNLSLNFGGAYNHAIYTDWHTATCPAEIPSSVSAVCDNTGKQVVGAPKWTGIIGINYLKPLDYGFKLHAYSNTVLRSKQNLESQLSVYGKQAGYEVTDAGIGLVSGKKDKYEVDLFAKNLFDTKYTTSVNAFSNSAPVGYDGIGARRYVGLVFKSNF